MIFVRIRIHGVFKHLLAVVIGLVITMWQTLNCIETSDTTSKFSHLLNIFQSWWQGSSFSLAGDDKLIFVVFITFLTWLIGYLSAWFVLRRNNAWVAVVLGALVILFNLSNLPDTYYIYFILYFFAAALLIAVTRMTARSSGAVNTANYSWRQPSLSRSFAALYYGGGSFHFLGCAAGARHRPAEPDCYQYALAEGCSGI